MSLEDKTRPELVKIGAERGVPESNKKTKAELLEALSALEAQIEATGEPEPDVVFEAEEPVIVRAEGQPDHYPSPYGRRVVQKAVLYTDGVSGVADLNHERAYEYNERLQSSDPNERTTGDVSVSEAALEQRTEQENRRADFVKRSSTS